MVSTMVSPKTDVTLTVREPLIGLDGLPWKKLSVVLDKDSTRGEVMVIDATGKATFLH